MGSGCDASHLANSMCPLFSAYSTASQDSIRLREPSLVMMFFSKGESPHCTKISHISLSPHLAATCKVVLGHATLMDQMSALLSMRVFACAVSWCHKASNNWPLRFAWRLMRSWNHTRPTSGRGWSNTSRASDALSAVTPVPPCPPSSTATFGNSNMSSTAFAMSVAMLSATLAMMRARNHSTASLRRSKPPGESRTLCQIRFSSSRLPHRARNVSTRNPATTNASCGLMPASLALWNRNCICSLYALDKAACVRMPSFFMASATSYTHHKRS
mmetsp:Transcript_20735/g.55548  ORF Transcript_20735/g.55548 Transcript_20735/m.55548 type:complete len:273 (-) Transcript_20735:1570-2388(-)